MNLLRILWFIVSHPLNSRCRMQAVLKFISYQLAVRFCKAKLVVDWVNDTKFLVSKGETGLTGNLYCGLNEYDDMAFLLHYLAEDDTFYDIGANVGSFTLLASGVIKARSVSFEPLPSTFDRFIDQIRINRLDELVEAKNKGVGDKAGTLEFTNNLNCTNRVNTDPSYRNVTKVDVITLDECCAPTTNTFVKIDVEGYEKFVLDGGANFFSNTNVSALIIELNGSGTSFGVNDNDVHKTVTSAGFQPIAYDPFNRKVLPLETFRRGGNTIYVRDIAFAQNRVATSPSVYVHTANSLKL